MRTRPARRLKHVVTFQAGNTPSTDDERLWADEGGIPWVAIGDMTGQRVVTDTTKNVSTSGLAAARLRVGMPGTVLLAMYASVGQTASLGVPAVWNQAILGLSPLPGRADPRFLGYWLESIRSAWSALFRSNTQDNLNAEVVGNAPFPGWPIQAQGAIAEYLDVETARIDRMIDALGRRASLLDMRKRAAVSTALGSVATATVAVRRVVDLVTSGPRGWSDLVVDSGTRLFLRMANVPRDSISLRLGDVAYIEPPLAAEADRCRVRPGDVLTTITAAIGQVAVVPAGLGEAYVSQHLALIRPAPSRVVPEWLALALWTDDAQRQLDAARYGGTKQQLALDDVRDVRIPWAPLSQQRNTVGPVLRDLETLTEAWVRTRRAMDLLRERRRALITAAVTGQIEIPGVVA
jgi:type I restriction enzyme S subunit